MPPERLSRRTYARVGLLGNPSDGFFGKVISMTVNEFYAEVTIQPSECVEISPHPEHDSCRHKTLDDLSQAVAARGCSGGVQLLLATCHVFSRHCTQQGIQIPGPQFSMTYDTNIPRQIGLSGSSAIVISALNCLIDFYSLAERIPKEVRPGLALSAEQELGITAGLQDRVIQVYGGLLFMDFEERHMRQHGSARCEAINPGLLSPLWLIYARNPSNSGQVHSDVKRRWDEGEPLVRQLMAEVAALAPKGREALQRQDWEGFARLMDRNFDLRRRIFGDAVLGATNIRMVELVRSTGGSAKFTGSGGAVVALFPTGETAAAALQETKALCAQEGFTIIQTHVAPATESPDG